MASGCGSATTQHNAAVVTPSIASPSPVPWLALAPTNVTPQPAVSSTPPTPIPAGTAACTAGQLDAVAQASYVSAHATETPIAFRNHGASGCYLKGFPDLTIVDSSGAAVGRVAGPETAGQFATFPVVPILLQAGGQALLYVVWFDCSHTSARLAIDLPDAGGRLEIDYAVNPYSSSCAGTVGSGASRSPFAPTGVPWPPIPKTIAVDVSLQAPARASQGSTLVYYVTIRNTSRVDYPLEPCPDYFETLLTTDQFQLNCAPVGHIAPGDSVTFEMHLTVSSDVPPGSRQLTWYLSDARLVKASSQTLIEITT